MLQIILCVILIILIALLFLPVRLYLRYNNTFSFSFSVAGIRIKPRNGKKKKSKNEESSTPEKEEHFVEKTATLSERITKFSDAFSTATRLTRKLLNVDKLIVQINIGTGNAATTAVSTGMLWATVYNLIALLGRIIIAENPSVEITPDYKNTTFKAYAKCIISTRIVYIILIGIIILLKKARKGKEE